MQTALQMPNQMQPEIGQAEKFDANPSAHLKITNNGVANSINNNNNRWMKRWISLINVDPSDSIHTQMATAPGNDGKKVQTESNDACTMPQLFLFTSAGIC